MILAYLWLDEPNIKPKENLGYNFYGKYNFRFDGKNTITVTENEDYIDNFYKSENIDNSCIDSLSCIVGGNGSGKTTLIHNLVDLLTPVDHIENLNLIKYNHFALLIDAKKDKKNELYYIYYKQNEKLIKKEKITNNIETKVKIIDKTLEKCFTTNDLENYKYNDIINKYKKNNTVFHYSNFVDEFNINTLDYHDSNLFDLQTKKLIIDYKFKHKLHLENDTKSKFNIFQLEEFNNIFEFLLEYNTFVINQFFKEREKNNLDFLIRDKITFEPFFDNYNNYDYLKVYFTSRFGNDSIERNILKRINELIKHKIIDPSSFYNLKKLDKKEFQEKFVYNILWQFTLSIWFLLELLVLCEKHINITESLYNYYFENDYLPTIKTPNECLIRIFDFLKHILKENEENILNKYDSIKSNILSFFEYILKNSSLYLINYYNEEIIDVNKVNKLILDVKNKKIILNFIEKYKNSIKDFEFGNYCKFGWLPQMSSGEYSLITLLSRLFAAIKEAVKDKNFLLILIDEGEIGFHPYWQKKYVASLIEFFEITLKILKREDVKIQLIITTNNPIPLSDIQPSDVIYLENHKVKEMKNKKAFGTDLLTLYSDSFFINDGLIGKFADSKIKELINECKNKKKFSKEELSYYKKLSNIVGDNFIKHYLIELVQNKEKTND